MSRTITETMLRASLMDWQNVPVSEVRRRWEGGKYDAKWSPMYEQPEVRIVFATNWFPRENRARQERYIFSCASRERLREIREIRHGAETNAHNFADFARPQAGHNYLRLVIKINHNVANYDSDGGRDRVVRTRVGASRLSVRSPLSFSLGQRRLPFGYRAWKTRTRRRRTLDTSWELCNYCCTACK